MRVLVCCRPGFGHFHPFVPLSRALADAGHEVVIATGESLAPQVAAAGFSMIKSGPSIAAAQQATTERFPEYADLRKELTWYRGLAMFASVTAPEVVTDLLAEVDARRPDLLLFEVTEFAAPMVAAVRDIPAVLVSWGPARPPELIEYGAMRAADTWRSLGLVPPADGGMRSHPFIDICPPSLQTPWLADMAEVIPMRHIPYESPAPDASSSWHPPSGERLLVYVTLGTVFGAAELFKAAIEGASRCEVDVVATIGPTGDPATLGAQPPNVRIERYIPQSELLPHVACFVSHLGSGAMMGAATYGVPHVGMPQGADQFVNADALEHSGAGLALRSEHVSAGEVEAAVRQALDDAALAVAARRLAEETAARPHPRDVVPELERLIRSSGRA